VEEEETTKSELASVACHNRKRAQTQSTRYIRLAFVRNRSGGMSERTWKASRRPTSFVLPVMSLCF
jgi:transposase-like protein